MNLGTAFHTLTLEPEKFSEEFAIEPVNAPRNTTIGKQKWEHFESELNGRSPISQKDFEVAETMAQNARIIGETLFNKEGENENLGD